MTGIKLHAVTAEIGKDLQLLVGKLIVTYYGSPQPRNLAHLGSLYRVDSVNGRHINVTGPSGEVSSKKRVMAQSIAFFSEDEEGAVATLSAMLGEQLKRRDAFVERELGIFEEALSTPVHKPKTVIRDRSR